VLPSDLEKVDHGISETVEKQDMSSAHQGTYALVPTSILKSYFPVCIEEAPSSSTTSHTIIPPGIKMRIGDSSESGGDPNIITFVTISSEQMKALFSGSIGGHVPVSPNVLPQDLGTFPSYRPCVPTTQLPLPLAPLPNASTIPVAPGRMIGSEGGSHQGNAHVSSVLNFPKTLDWTVEKIIAKCPGFIASFEKDSQDMSWVESFLELQHYIVSKQGNWDGTVPKECNVWGWVKTQKRDCHFQTSSDSNSVKKRESIEKHNARVVVRRELLKSIGFIVKAKADDVPE
jgi:hypothetical protein